VKVTGIWSLAGAVVVALVVADLVIHPAGTAAATNGITSIERNVGNQVIGTPAK
jgi:hypothetical protein